MKQNYGLRDTKLPITIFRGGKDGGCDGGGTCSSMVGGVS